MSRALRQAAAGLALTAVLVVGASPAAADPHDPKRSGHPLRILAYAFHPIGVVLDTLIFRPAHWVVGHEPLATLFGHEED